MKIRQLRILPPFAIGRLGSASEQLDNYVIEDDPDNPLNFRRIRAAGTLIVDQRTGEIVDQRFPETITFKSGERIRPVAPFLEVFAVIVQDNGEETIQPLDLTLLNSLGIEPANLAWRAP